ncbi:MAG TPA: hypothetical protein VH593_24775 [Ktedonobacteraceae bacterium]
MSSSKPGASAVTGAAVEKLASYQHCVQRLQIRWPAFLQKRMQRLTQQERHGVASEKVAENIVEDLFTEVLDWELGDLNNQVEYADIILSKEGIKYLLVETKRPGALAWNQRAVERALAQALRYAAEQKVTCVAISDGGMLYAANFHHGGLEDRIYVSLSEPTPPLDLWWLSVHGIYRPCNIGRSPQTHLLPQEAEPDILGAKVGDQLLHPKYHLPASCFAYVGNPAHPDTWKLPYCLEDGSIDEKRLPKAIQAILSNYRGAKVSSIPEQDIPAVLARLASGVERIGKMPHQRADTAEVYQQLAEVLEQFGTR